MNITLLAMNAKYVHASLAVWVLARGVEKYSRQRHDVYIAEATVNQGTDDIAEQVASQNPDLIGISTYIWNAGKLPGLLDRLRKRLPEAIIVLGGPEASHNAAYWLAGGADYVLGGEGEYSFPALLDALAGNATGELREIPGLVYRRDGKAQVNPQVAPPNEYISPYSNEYFKVLGGRIAYIETSRGCPFHCAYCLSGGSGVRFFPMNEIKEQLYKLSKSGARTIKFVDRTFNCSRARAYEILEYVIGLDTGCRLHFEAAADLFDQRTLKLLSMAPPGRIQLEIGLQSFHQPTLDAVSRKTDLEAAEESIRKLLLWQNIHVHVDLIAGLPYEPLPVFEESFNRTYALGAHMLQLGFLKLLHGSKLREQAKELGIVYRKESPYEIISSPWLGEGDLEILKYTENALQHTYNKGRFLSVLRYVLSVSGERPFALFRGLGEMAQNHATPLETYAGQVYAYCAGLPNVDQNELRDYMICDLLQMTKGKNIPAFLKSYGEKRKQAAAMAEKQLGRVIDYDEAAVLSSGKGVYADSMNRDPVTGLYKLHFLH